MPFPPFAESLALEPDGEGGFATSLADYGGRIFGGEVLAKLLLAAAHDVEDRRCHSLHGYFLRPVAPGAPMRLASEPLSGGRRFAARRATLRAEGGRIAAEAQVSFTRVDEGAGFEAPLDLAGVPPADSIPAGQGWSPEDGEVGPLDWRYLERPWEPAREGEYPGWRAWIRPTLPLGDDPHLHAAVLAYISDFGSLAGVERRFGNMA